MAPLPTVLNFNGSFINRGTKLRLIGAGMGMASFNSQAGFAR
ncbi:hypothetical protein FBR6_0890 [Lactiplantibacillus plantarum]|nr:hypothetical protein FBR6_0890 [Lactiplantibacillus plantarum]